MEIPVPIGIHPERDRENPQLFFAQVGSTLLVDRIVNSPILEGGPLSGQLIMSEIIFC